MCFLSDWLCAPSIHAMLMMDVECTADGNKAGINCWRTSQTHNEGLPAGQ